jgi:hypothetical protein
MISYRFIFLIVLLIILGPDIAAQQITPNHVDSLGLKQGMWREFKIPYTIMTNNIRIKVPEITSEYYDLSEKEDRKYFPIIESIGKYENGLKTGIWFEYHGNGNIKSQIEYKEGIPNGYCQMFWGNGILKAEFTINYSDSIPVKMYDVNGDFENIIMAHKIAIIQTIYTD